MQRRLRFESLEGRRLLAVDLHFGGPFDGVAFVSADGASLTSVADPTPVAGQKAYVAADWTAEGLGGADNYAVHFEMDGAVLPVAFTGDQFAGWFHGGWIALPGANPTITVTLDADNQIAEDDETNNTFTLPFATRSAESLPAKFSTPIAGKQNVDWVLGGYVDVDPLFFSDDPNDPFEDYQGNKTTTRDFHNGYDFGVANFAAQDAGVEILAAAGGTVTLVHDADFDRETALNFSNPGNRVFIDHGDGWVSQYFHLRRDSATVEVGQTVETGDVLGLVGSSGNSAAPHLHFEVQHLGSPVETFVAPEQYYVPSDVDDSGRSDGADFLALQRSSSEVGGWQTEFGRAPLPYVFDSTLPNTLLDFGVTNDIQNGVATGFGLPTEQFVERPSEVTAFPGNGEWILAWAVASSVEAGDTFEAQLFRPDGSLVEDFDAASFDVSRPVDSKTYNPGVTENIPGDWRVDFLYNGVKVGERQFEVGPSTPEIRVFQRDAANVADAAFLLDGRTTPVDFGVVVDGGAGATQVFRIENHGYAELVVAETVAPDGYSLVEAPPASIAAGASATFSVMLDALGAGVKSGVIEIHSNDSDEGVFTFAVEGEVAANATVSLLLPPNDEPAADSVGLTEEQRDASLVGRLPGRAASSLTSDSAEVLTTRSRVRRFHSPAAYDRAIELLDFAGALGSELG